MIRLPKLLLTGLLKVIGREGRRKSRIHSGRGPLATRAELTSLPRALVTRLLRRPLTEPWLSPSAVTALDRELHGSDILLELGGGSSTAWFARRVGHIITVEPSPQWAAKIRAHTAGLTNVDILEMPIQDALSALTETPTVVLIDHNAEGSDMTRPDAAYALARRYGATLRLVVLDDSDRDDLRGVEETIAPYGFVPDRYRSFRSRPLQLTETTIFRRSKQTLAHPE